MHKLASIFGVVVLLSGAIVAFQRYTKDYKEDRDREDKKLVIETAANLRGRQFVEYYIDIRINCINEPPKVRAIMLSGLMQAAAIFDNIIKHTENEPLFCSLLGDYFKDLVVKRSEAEAGAGAGSHDFLNCLGERDQIKYLRTIIEEQINKECRS